MSSYNPTSTKQAWDNHFSAFGEQNLEKILLDYTESSVLKAYDSTTKNLTTATGISEIRDFFAGLFKALSDLSTLDAPVVEVTEEPFKQVYLNWSCTSSGILHAHDSFYFDDKFRITRQNIGYTSQPSASHTAEELLPAPSASHTAEELFTIHGTRFMAKDVEGLSAEYDEKSVMKLSVNQGPFSIHTGWDNIKLVFESLFDAKTGGYGDGAAVSVQAVDFTPTSAVLLWSSAGGPNDVKHANDTFIINSETNKWALQTVFVHHA